MQPIEFDRKFARYVSQVDSRQISRGTALYEAGRAQVRTLGESIVKGSVSERDGDLFAVTLQDNPQGGLSGSCTCDEFFNCAHSYALARAVRDVLQHRAPPSASEGPPVAGKRAKAADSPALQQARERLSEPLSAKQTELVQAAEKLWKIAKPAGFRLFPRDLRPFTPDGSAPQLPPSEPLRAIQRWLPKDRETSPLVLADAIRSFCQSKGIPLHQDFESITRPAPKETKKPHAHGSQNRWKDRPLKLAYRFKLAGTGDRDWFNLTAEPYVEGLDLAPQQIQEVLSAPGNMLKLPDVGWVRIQPEVDNELAQIAQDFGIDPFRGNQQRIHAMQVRERIPAEHRLPSEFWEKAASRASELTDLPSPDAPNQLAKILRPYQLEGFRFLARLSQYGSGGLLADDMGLGKTLQTLAWLKWLEGRQVGSSLRALVICPKSVMDNWLQEPAKFKTGLIAAPFTPDRIESTDLRTAHVVVANYAQLRLHAAYFEEQPWSAAILDEGQFIKNPSSQTAQIAYRLNAPHRLVLTGTPIENHLLDLWSLMRFAMPRLLGPQATFLANYNPSNDPKALERVKRRIAPFFLRRRKSEVAADLPDRIEKDLRCELEGRQAELYRAELESARQILRSLKQNSADEAGRFNILSSLLRLRQICCDPSLIDGECDEDAPSAKVQALLDLLPPIVAEGHKVIVFSQFVSVIELLKKQLDAVQLPSLSLTGKTQDRARLVERFQQESSEPIFLLSLKAAGSGLNLTAASYVVLFDPWWNPAVEAQAIDRAHRIGQHSRVIAYRLIAKETVEEKIRSIQREKADLARAVFGDDGGAATSLDMATLENVLFEERTE